jgi:hypothetical protein
MLFSTERKSIDPIGKRNVIKTKMSSGDIRSSARIFCRFNAEAKLCLSGFPSTVIKAPVALLSIMSFPSLAQSSIKPTNLKCKRANRSYFAF